MMGAKSKWPGGVVQHANRAEAEVEGFPDTRSDCLSTNRQTQVPRLMNRNGMSLKRTYVITSGFKAPILCTLIFQDRRDAATWKTHEVAA